LFVVFENQAPRMETEMNLFHLHVEGEQGATSRSRTWLVIADSLFEAISVVPDGFSVKAVEVQVGGAVDPRRVIKSIGVPVVY
jgi:hypothetical protein